MTPYTFQMFIVIKSIDFFIFLDQSTFQKASIAIMILTPENHDGSNIDVS